MGFFDLFKRKKTEQPKVEESKPVESVAQPVVETAIEPQPEEPKVEVIPFVSTVDFTLSTFVFM